MSDSVEIKPLKRRDLAALRLIARVYFPTEAWLTVEYLEELERRSVVAYTIRWGERLVGGAIITADKHPNYWLDFMVIDRNVGRRGLGEQLFLAAERELESGVMLWHAAPDTKAFASTKKFMTKMGMEARGSLRGWFGRNDAAVYAKRIR
ncbi:MAG: GNAT family N-acetyltransferase [Candidatus Andersenbacteria bacterium]